MGVGTTTVILFALLVLFLALGVPLSFCLGGVAIIVVLWQIGPHFLYGFASTAFTGWSNFILIAVPLFILMGNLLEVSGVAEDLYGMMYKWLGRTRGGLASGTVVICAIFAAMAGISGVATVTMGLIALPSMLRRNYDKILAVGTISAGGTLGILIPPSVIMILYASLTGESVGKLFMGGVFPGLILATLFILYIQIRTFLQPSLAPPVPDEERATFRQKLASTRGLAMPALLVALVLGVIYTGICTPTEAAGIGAFGALICVIVQRRFTGMVFWTALVRTFSLTAMLMWIVLGAKCFTHAYHAIGAPDLILGLISGLEVNRWIIMIAMQLILIVLGMFLDPMGIMLICTPIFLPIVEELGFSTLWFGILFTINMELAYITPPFGFNLFYMRSIVPKEVTMADIYRSIIPFALIMVLGLAIVMVFQQLAIWLPSTMF